MSTTLPKLGGGRRRSPKPKRGENLGPVLEEIDQLIGLDPVKDELNRIIAFASVMALKKERDIPFGSINLHMVFTGPPGTGKTTIARYIGKILYEIRLLRKGHLVEADRSQMVGSHLGETAKIVTDKVKEALDGVLFIDEAYTLAGGGGATARTDPYGQEAIDTLLKLMEDNRDRLVVIFAGYTNEMRRFLEANPGLKSRISRQIEFPSYTEDELFGIFQVMVEQHHFNLTPDAEDEARKHISWMGGAADENFGNAREIRQFFESLQPIQAERLADEFQNLDEIPDEALLTLTDEDVRLVADA